VSKKNKSLRQAAIALLAEIGPAHYQQLTEQILARGLAQSTSKTPAASLNAVIAVDIKRYGADSDFVRVRPGVFGLRDRAASTSSAPTPAAPRAQATPTAAALEDPERRVRIPLFPLYSKVRQLLPVWHERPRRQIAGLHAALAALRGTPQKTEDWTEPDTWIPARLAGEERELAAAIWNDSGKTVNPRHTYGHWLLVQKYQLLAEGEDGVLRLTDRGRDFLHHENGEAEAFLDEQEGLAKLLGLVADSGPARTSGLLEEWAEYLARHSAFRSDATLYDALRRRLNNLIDRGLVARKSAMYSITDEGLAYLERVGSDDAMDDDALEKMRALKKKQASSVRESLLELLLEMDPNAFEHLVKELLERMDYQDVQVTAQSGDGGVDVIAEIELGVTWVREVVQAKRHRRAIQRKEVDALRGSLYRFGAVRGAIIATSRFAKGARDAALESGAPPITLIDGDKLIDLMIQHGLGVQKHQFELLTVDADALSKLESEEALAEKP